MVEMNNSLHHSPAEVPGGQPYLDLPLSEGQRALWFLQRLNPEYIGHNMVHAARARVPIDLIAAQRALQRVVDRHPSLRTSIVLANGEPLQRVFAYQEVCFHTEDISGLTEEQVNERLNTEVTRPIDLEKDPLFQVTFFSRSPYDHLMIIRMHHIVSDMWSLAIILYEANQFYRSEVTGEPIELKPPQHSYFDFIHKQTEIINGPEGETILEYWRKRLNGDLPVLNIPSIAQNTSNHSGVGAAETILLDKVLSEQLRNLSRTTQTPLYIVMLAALQGLLSRYTNQEKILTGFIKANRIRETARVVGYFVNPILIPTDLSGEPTFSSLLKNLQKDIEQDFSNDSYPFPLLLEKLHFQHVHLNQSIPQVMFAWQKTTKLVDNKLFGSFAIQAEGRGMQLGIIPFETVSLPVRACPFDLAFYMAETDDAIGATLEYRTDIYDGRMIHRMLEHFHQLLESIVQNPDRSISSLPLLTEADKDQILVKWNNTSIEIPPIEGFHQLIEHQAKLNPQATAVTGGGESLTYEEMDLRSEQLALRLRRLGVVPETPVGICLERSVDMVIGLLGILKAGGAYLPLDPYYPVERLKWIIQDAGTKVLLTRTSMGIAKQLVQGVDSPPTLVYVDEDPSDTDYAQTEKPIPVPLNSDHLAYIFYTSGSTGLPKGVQINHRSVVNYLVSMQKEPGLSPQDTFLAISSLSFDSSVLEIFLPLTVGAHLVIASRASTYDGHLLIQELVSSQATAMMATPVTWQMLLDASWSGDKRLKALCGGEALIPELAGQILERVGSLWNLYGPTETTAWCMLCRITDPKPPISIGRPIANTKIFVLNDRFQPVPIGVPGELFIGGEGLARGYVNRPDLNKDKFINISIDPETNLRLYRSGDIVRFLEDGRLEFLGRSDNQVKLRGFRIELGEIESVLKSNPAVRQAVVLLRENPNGDKYLQAVIRHQPEISNESLTQTLRYAIRQTLPDYMMPASFVYLDEFPLTSSLKVDRKALLRITQEVSEEKTDYFTPPRNPIEIELANIWANVLELPQVGVHDNFFDLGGHSLLATRLTARIERAIGVTLPLQILFNNPTISGIAEYILAVLKKTPTVSQPNIPRIPRSIPLPLGFSQERLWFIHQLNPSPAYHVPITLRLIGNLDADILQRSLQQVIDRHEILRTTLQVIDDTPMQVISPVSEYKLSLIDLRHLPAEEREGELNYQLEVHAQEPYDLAQGPLFRAILFRLDNAEHVVALNLHHTICDAWSIGILGRELASIYEAFSSGRLPDLPRLPIQFADYAAWQRHWFQGGSIEKQMDFWKKQLEGISVLNLPTDFPRPTVQTYRGSFLIQEQDPELVENLRAMSRQQGVSLFMTMLAAFNILLYRYTGQEDIVLGLPIANRHWLDTENLIGPLVNTLLLRTNLTGNPSFCELLHRVREVALQVYAHQDMPFEKLVAELQPERDTSYTPLFQVMFNYTSIQYPSIHITGLQWSPVVVNRHASQFDLTFTISDVGDQLLVSIEYNADLFKGSTISRFLTHFQTLLKQVINNPDQSIAYINFLTDEERHQILFEWNNTLLSDLPKACIHSLFETQVEKTPEATALVYEKIQVSYREVNEQANQIAHFLKKLGIREESVVGVCLERSPGLVSALLGIMKAGGAYLPLSPTHPMERLAFMIADAQVNVILTRDGLRQLLPANDVKTICVDSDRSLLAQESKENLALPAKLDQLAYVIYTSGSTGTPKGILSLHIGAINRFQWMWKIYPFSPTDVCCHKTSINFVDSIWEIFGPLLKGIPAVIFSDEIVKDGHLFVQALTENRVTRIVLVPSLINVILDTVQEIHQNLPDLHFWVTSGETISPEIVQRFYTKFPNARLLNLYGSSEASADSTCYEISRSLDFTTIPIGKPISNTQVYILDTNLQLVPIGVQGELFIGGAGLARGYLNHADWTSERFIPNPFNPEISPKLYRTGDLARFLPDGNIEYLGRIGNQIKIRGMRVEVGEIETILRQHPAVSEAAVWWINDSSETKRLVAYLIPKDIHESKDFPISAHFRQYLARWLPDYMIPAHFIKLEQLPLTTSGKVDYHALPTLDLDQLDQNTTEESPRDQIEQMMLNLWEEVLGQTSISVQDNFFEIGGHSLLAIRLFSRIERELGQRLPIITIFQTPTIEGLAEIIRSGKVVDQNPVLVPIQPSGSETPFFCIHGFGGGVTGYYDLAQLLGEDQPFIGVQAKGFESQDTPHTDVEEMASYYLTAIRTAQPKGPYYLGGYCYGGVVAFEIARQLETLGEEVALLAIFEGYAPIRADTGIYLKPLNILNFLKNVPYWLHDFRKISGNQKLARVIIALRYLRKSLFGTYRTSSWLSLEDVMDNADQIPERQRVLMETHINAMLHYYPQPIRGQLTLFRVRGLSLFRSFDPTMGWSRLTKSGVQMRIIDGAHFNMTAKPQVESLARHLKASIKEARRRHISG
jgi:amino acid adenylation domain-containing protein